MSLSGFAGLLVLVGLIVWSAVLTISPAGSADQMTPPREHGRETPVKLAPAAPVHRVPSRPALGDDTGAETEFLKAVKLAPDFAEPLNHLGMIKKAAGDLAAAVELYLESLERRPNYPEVHYNLALALTARQELEAAEISLPAGAEAASPIPAGDEQPVHAVS